MVFSSLEFIFVYLAAVLLIYFAVPFRAKNLVLLIFSLAFYGWGEPALITLMVVTILIDYVCGYLIGLDLDRNPCRAKVVLIIAVVTNLALLGYFKYYDFFVSSLNSVIPGLSLETKNITLPIGISFYTFQSLSYVIDVYRRDARMQKNIASFGTYVTLFPQLIAGPIVRYADVDNELRYRTHSIDLFASGIRTFVCGLAKKLLLANSAGAMWETLSAAEAPTALGSWMGIIFYSFQIYFDFSAYSDMAIGLGKMLGFTFRENFYYPYISKSVTEFWRRWHISLSTWFREYVYIPLGGNRKGKGRTYFNLFAVWFLTGLWHGASWNFVLWGLYYFVLLVIEKAFLLKLLEKLPSAVAHVYALITVIFGWLLFVAEDLTFIGTYLSRMFTAPFADSVTVYDLVRNLVFIAILCIASTPLPKRLWYKLWDGSKVCRIGTAAVCCGVFILCIAYMVSSSYNPFLYFRF